MESSFAPSHTSFIPPTTLLPSTDSARSLSLLPLTLEQIDLLRATGDDEMNGDHGWSSRKADGVSSSGAIRQQQQHGWPEPSRSAAAATSAPGGGRRSDNMGDAGGLNDAIHFSPGYMSPPPPGGAQQPPPPFPHQRMRRELSFDPPGAFGGFQQQQQQQQQYPPPPPHMQQQTRALGGESSLFDLGGGASMGSMGMAFSLGPPLPGSGLLSSSPLDNRASLGMAAHPQQQPPLPPPPMGLGLDLGLGGGPPLGGHVSSGFLGMAPPSVGSGDLSGSQQAALYHLQFQQQRHQHLQQQLPPHQSQGFGLQQQHHHHQQQHSGPIGGRFPSQQQQQQSLASPRSQFDLSQSMLKMNLNASSGSIGSSIGSSIGGGSSGGLGDSAASMSSSSSSLDPFASWASASSSSTASSSSLSLRDQMNQQMAALYQRELTNDHQPLAQSGTALLGLLNNSREFDSSSNTFPDLPDLTSSQLLGAPLVAPMLSPQQQQQQHAYRGPPQQPVSGGLNNRQSRRSPAKPANNFSNSQNRDQGGGSIFSRSRGENKGGVTEFVSSIEVSPESTKPNGNIKVQVSLLAEECSPGRVLMVGLFRGGQMTNERPIFVKQVLFENKLNRNYRFLNTRITFRAPRSPGEFEFRVFESKKSTNGLDDRDNTLYSNVTIARSNKLKVNMEYSHFIETLRSTNDKFRNGMQEGDSGAIMSSLLSILRLVDQVETVFLHGNVLFSEFVDSCLLLVSLNESRVSDIFPASDAIPNPMESFHGTMRNVLNGIQSNPFVKELVSEDILRKVNAFQREFYCQASGYYFPRREDRHAYWQKHFGFAPFAFSSSDEQGQGLLQSKFVCDAVSEWIQQEATQLIPEKDEFRRARQEIYNVFHTQVVSRLPIKTDLDVFGSSANDFGTSESDMDMCLVLEKSATTEEKQQILRVVVALLERQPHLFTEIDSSRLTARIPIVMFKMKESGIECDLCVENVLAQRNTAFLRAYANADERVRTLAYVIKRFVKRRRMNSASEGTLSSYGYLLMLIHYLQRQEPPILPVLQSLSPTWDGSSKCDCTPSRVWCSLQSPQCSLSERHPEMHLPSVLGKGPADDNDASSGGGKVETYFFDPFAFQDPPAKLQLLRSFGARNKASIGELLIGFFEYFGLQFDASRQVVSVRMARNLSKEEKKRECQWRMHTRLSIEDPFEVGYDVAHVLKGSRDKYIRQQFAWAYTMLVQGSLDARDATESSSESAARVANIMAKLIEEVKEPSFLQPDANVLSGLTAADEDDLDGNEDERAGAEQET